MAIDVALAFEDGEIRLGNETLPGILVSLSVRDAVRYDQAQTDHMSGKAKVALGWEDASVTVVLDLLSDAQTVDGKEVWSLCYDKLAVLNRIFKGTGAKSSTPAVYAVVNRHLRARGISRVVFDSLDSYETDCDDVIQATLVFTEHLPAVVKREQRSNAAGAKAPPVNTKPAGTGAPSAKAEPPADPAITEDTTNPFLAGFKAGFN